MSYSSGGRPLVDVAATIDVPDADSPTSHSIRSFLPTFSDQLSWSMGNGRGLGRWPQNSACAGEIEVRYPVPAVTIQAWKPSPAFHVPRDPKPSSVLRTGGLCELRPGESVR